ncbi:unnamed protein product, partial [Ectocarpus sp. 8 AP-2014]
LHQRLRLPRRKEGSPPRRVYRVEIYLQLPKRCAALAGREGNKKQVPAEQASLNRTTLALVIHAGSCLGSGMDDYDSGSAADPMDQDHQQDHFAPVASSQSPVSPIGSLGGSLDGMLDNFENLDGDGISLDIDENGNVVLNPTDW